MTHPVPVGAKARCSACRATPQRVLPLVAGAAICLILTESAAVAMPAGVVG